MSTPTISGRPYDMARLLTGLERLVTARTPVRMDHLSAREPATAHNSVVIRCDIERDLEHTLWFAEQLSARSIPCTMYFHTREDTYDPKIFAEIGKLGHEIGFHHECLDRCGGDFEAAKRLFEKEVERFKQDGFSLVTVCSHGEAGLPKQGYSSNRDLFSQYPELLAESGIAAEVYEGIKSRFQPFYISDVFSAYRFFYSRMEAATGRDELVQVLIHPHRWRESFVRSAQEVALDLKQHLANRIFRKRSYQTVWDRG